MKKKLVSVLKLLFFLGLGALFIWLFVKDLTQAEADEIRLSFGRANYWWIGLSLVVALLSHVLRTLRWRLLMDPMGYKPGFLNVFMALMIGYFANLALPRLGEITRCTVLAKYEKIPFQKGLGTVVAERAFDVLTFLVLFFINLIVQYTLLYEYVNEKIFIPLAEKAGILGQAWFLYGAIAFLVIVVVVLYVMRRKLERFSLWRKLTGILSGFGDGLKSLLKLKRPFLFLLYTVLMWFMYFLMTWICFYSLAGMGGLGMQAAFSVLVLGTIGIMLVQGGVGIYPAIVAETLFLYGAASTTAYALGWLIWSAQTFALILAGIVSLILLPIINKSKNGQNGHPEKEDPVAA